MDIPASMAKRIQGCLVRECSLGRNFELSAHTVADALSCCCGGLASPDPHFDGAVNNAPLPISFHHAEITIA